MTMMTREDKTSKILLWDQLNYTKAHYETMKHCPIDSKKYNECKEFMSDHNGTPLEGFWCIVG